MRIIALLAAASLLAACATSVPPEEVRAPEPLKPIDAERFYSGRWLEIARVPDRLTDGCVAGASTYDLQSDNRVAVRDTCQRDTPQGSEKGISGDGRITDPGMNAKMSVRYLWGFVTWHYWVLDRGDDYSWFISADPRFERLFIYTRELPSRAERDRLVARAAELGFDVSRLEFPEH